MRRSRDEVWLVTKFKALTNGLNAEQLNFLLSDELWDGLFFYDSETASVSPVAPHTIPWYVAFCLAWHHRKHRLCSGAFPRLSRVTECFNQFEDRIKWLHHFRRAGTVQTYKLRRKRTARFTEICPPEIRAWCMHLRCKVLGTCQSLLRCSSSKKRWWSNTSELHNLSRRWTLDNYVVLFGDKRGNIALAKPHQYASSHINWFKLPMYQSLPADGFTDSWWSALADRYVKLCKDVAQTDPSVTQSFLVSSLHRGKKGIILGVKNTCKTHKRAGDVKLRFLHTAAEYSFEALGKWFVHQLDKRLTTFRHITNSSSKFARDITSMSFPTSALVLHYDLDDFFNKGGARFLAENSSSLLYQDLRRVGKRVADFLLEHQYVRTGCIPDLIFNVLQGSGQGLTASGSIANSAFLMSHELNGASLARSSTKSRFGILFYRRYIDNLLFVIRDDTYLTPLLTHLRTGLSPYTGKIEEIGKESFEFLDSKYDFKRSPNVACFIQSPLMKLSARFLATSSSHSASTHVAWPVAYINSIWARSSDLHVFRDCKQQFLQALKSQGWEDALINYFNNATLYTRTYTNIEVRPRPPAVSKWWLTLPFHPLWASGPLTAALHRFSKEPQYFEMLRIAFEGMVTPQIRRSMGSTYLSSLNIVED
jgi:hypothetical protein